MGVQHPWVEVSRGGGCVWGVRIHGRELSIQRLVLNQWKLQRSEWTQAAF
jgi:hypothetical protein